MPRKTNYIIAQAEVDLRCEIGNNLALFREGRELDQKDLVAKYPEFLDRRSISAFESGARPTPLLFLCALCEDFDISLDYFIRRKLVSLDDADARKLLLMEAATWPNAKQMIERVRTAYSSRDRKAATPPPRKKAAPPPPRKRQSA